MKIKPLTLLLIILGQVTFAQKQFDVDVNKIGANINPDMYGVFFEDINFGADGGLYAELIKNRSFDFHQPFAGWLPFGNVEVMNESPCFDRNPNYVRLNETGLRRGTGLKNRIFNVLMVGEKNGVGLNPA